MDNPTPLCNPEVWGGIECTINRVQNSYFDQLTYSGHYNQLHDLELIAGLGIKKIRYPILWEKHQQQPLQSAIDWNWIEERLTYLQSKQIDVIAGLTHHGSGPSYTNLADVKYPVHLAEYAAKVAARFPWIEYYTPVNEPLTTARFSGLYGIWFPHSFDDKSFIKMLLNEVKGVVLSMQEIRKINPAAKLVQTEDLAKTYSTSLLQYQADFENERRWITFDLLCGNVDADHPLWNYLRGMDISEEELLFFQQNPCPPDILGFNHYLTSERYLDERIHLYPAHTHGGNFFHTYADVEAVRVEIAEETGIEVLLKEAWNRYHIPIAITEVHLHCHREEQLRWFKHIWNACARLVKEGIEIKAVTAWAMLGSYGWNRLLTHPNGDYEAGVFDLRNGEPRPTALAAFIKNLSLSEAHHPVLHTPGWWHRPTRVIYNTEPGFKKNTSFKHERKHPVLIIGKKGTLGRAFAKICHDRALQYIAVGKEECDITQPAAIEAVIHFYKPWAIVNAAGFVKVDDAENEFDACFEANALGPQNLAIACNTHGIKLISFSSDLVFDGDKKDYYVEQDATNPLNVYGKSKAYSEKVILQENPSALIIRTSAFFGLWDQYNFPQWIINELSALHTVPVANDVYISPTFVPDLVHVCLDLIIDDEKGIWHLANKGKITWADLALETARYLGLDEQLIKPMPLLEMNLPARRPYFSALSSTKGNLMPSVDNALQRFLEAKKEMVMA